MSDKYTDLLDTADRIAVVDLYPARLRTVISDLSAALRETSALLTESRDYGSALVEELRARTEKLDQLLLLANSMDADFESYTKVHPAVQPDAAAIREAALREAASYHEVMAADEDALSAKYRGGSSPWFAHIQRAEWHREHASAILALKGETP